MLLQAGALVNVYTDGTVLVTHGGVEMGQGLHTKIAQARPMLLTLPLRSQTCMQPKRHALVAIQPCCVLQAF